MIRVTVDIVPFGDEELSRTIGELVLANVANLGDGVASYDAVYKADRDKTPAYVTGVKHLREGGFWELIRKILEEEGISKRDAMYNRLCRRLTI